MTINPEVQNEPKTERYFGTLSSWHDTRGFGIVHLSRWKRYFLHTVHVVDGPEVPTVGCGVYFEISKTPPKRPNDLPMAINARIVEKSAGGAQ